VGCVDFSLDVSRKDLAQLLVRSTGPTCSFNNFLSTHLTMASPQAIRTVVSPFPLTYVALDLFI